MDYIKVGGDGQLDLDAHRHIYEALAAHDEKLVEELIRNHIRMARDLSLTVRKYNKRNMNFLGKNEKEGCGCEKRVVCLTENVGFSL